MQLPYHYLHTHHIRSISDIPLPPIVMIRDNTDIPRVIRLHIAIICLTLFAKLEKNTQTQKGLMAEIPIDCPFVMCSDAPLLINFTPSDNCIDSIAVAKPFISALVMFTP